ncbi:hypothetical protein CYLTODRAFT_402216 [Cylindrobasidium torrendii FP15055 ss-10]|uniref:VPS37 C-terminal domain-containing protein n=1 Tax=Cylindrobasidium torrendii FP15055 ss-10 TaxID=1314674 RepID=A0A0D7B0J6_9AGAR|nr:hypothetical protein CYLTODRAFT_402216 [Cylindrobasidium torrendii FP15055 ss-10]
MTTQLTQEFPELSGLSRQDLEDLLLDREYFQAVFHSLPRVKAMFESQSELGLANEAIARNNLALQGPLYQIRAETKEAFEHAKYLEARWKELEKEQKDVYQRFDPQFLHMRLRHSTTAQDEESEALATAFVQQQPPTGTATPSTQDIDSFVREFKKSRTIYHKRAMMGEKWTHGQVMWRDD